MNIELIMNKPQITQSNGNPKLRENQKGIYVGKWKYEKGPTGNRYREGWLDN